MSQTQLKDEINCPLPSKSVILTLQNQGNLLVLSAFFLPFLIKRKSKRETNPPTDCFFFFFDKPEKQHNREGEREISFGFSCFKMQIFQQRNHSRYYSPPSFPYRQQSDPPETKLHSGGGGVKARSVQRSFFCLPSPPPLPFTPFPPLGILVLGCNQSLRTILNGDEGLDLTHSWEYVTTCLLRNLLFFLLLLFYYHFAIYVKYYSISTEFRKMRQGSPWKLMRLIKRTTFKNT